MQSNKRLRRNSSSRTADYAGTMAVDDSTSAMECTVDKFFTAIVSCPALLQNSFSASNRIGKLARLENDRIVVGIQISPA